MDAVSDLDAVSKVDAVSDPVLAALGAIGVIPVATIERAADAEPVAAALTAAGVGCLEITLRTDAAMAAIEAARMSHPDLIVGAGTVLDAAAVDAVVDAGAQFVVSPGFDERVVERCGQLGVPTLPGAATATEMMRARAAGLAAVKFFPASAIGGVAGLATIAAAVGTLSFVPTGGIGPTDLPHYLALDAVLAVGGSWIVDRGLVADRRWHDIEHRAAAAAATVTAVRNGPAGHPPARNGEPT